MMVRDRACHRIRLGAFVDVLEIQLISALGSITVFMAEQQTNALRTDATREHRLGTLKPCSD